MSVNGFQSIPKQLHRAIPHKYQENWQRIRCSGIIKRGNFASNHCLMYVANQINIEMLKNPIKLTQRWELQTNLRWKSAIYSRRRDSFSPPIFSSEFRRIKNQTFRMHNPSRRDLGLIPCLAHSVRLIYALCVTVAHFE